MVSLRPLSFFLSCLRTGKCQTSSLSSLVAAASALYQVVQPSGTIVNLCKPTHALDSNYPVCTNGLHVGILTLNSFPSTGKHAQDLVQATLPMC